MKANKVTVKITVECLHIDAVRAILGDAIRQIDAGIPRGFLLHDDGDSVEWNTVNTSVEF